MRLLCKLALGSFLLWMVHGSGPACAAEPPRSAADDRESALLSPEQGQALADFAQRRGRGLRPKPDCSHLVHQIYSQAGLNYSYAGSRDLYYGSEDFERVFRPQPGDLIVWLGHVGIVVDPDEKTFFSSVRSGTIAESWVADYWLERGRPRFFRYRIGPATDRLLLAALVSQETAPQKMAPQKKLTPLDTEDVRVAPVVPTKNAARSGTPAAAKTVAQSAFKPVNAPTSSAASANNGPSRNGTLAASGQRLPAAPAESPTVIAVLRQRAKPSRQDVATALAQSNSARAQRFSAGELLDLARPVSVIAHVEVQKVKIKHDSGSVDLKLTETLSLDANKVNPARTLHREFSLTRRGDTWVISDPQARCLIPEDQAVRVFEQQAELFLRQNPAGPGTRTIVKALDILFDREAAGAQRAALK